MKVQHKSGFCHNLIICCEIKLNIHQSVVIPTLKLRRRNLMYNSSIIIATHMSYNYFPCVKGGSKNTIRKYLPIFHDTLITACCLGSYTCTVVLETGNMVYIKYLYYHVHFLESNVLYLIQFEYYLMKIVELSVNVAYCYDLLGRLWQPKLISLFEPFAILIT